MFAKWKAKFAAKKANAHAVDESRRWKENALFQDCLQAMRGSCTVAPADLHEAVITAVNIAIREGTWAELSAASEDLFGGMVYLVWGEATLPVLWAPWAVAVENPDCRSRRFHRFGNHGQDPVVQRTRQDLFLQYYIKNRDFQLEIPVFVTFLFRQDS